MESRLAKYIFTFMRANKIESSKVVAEKAGVGWNWLRALYARSGEGNPTSIPLEGLHDYLVENHGMKSILLDFDAVHESKSERVA